MLFLQIRKPLVVKMQESGRKKEVCQLTGPVYICQQVIGPNNLSFFPATPCRHTSCIIAIPGTGVARQLAPTLQIIRPPSAATTHLLPALASSISLLRCPWPTLIRYTHSLTALMVRQKIAWPVTRSETDRRSPFPTWTPNSIYCSLDKKRTGIIIHTVPQPPPVDR